MKTFDGYFSVKKNIEVLTTVKDIDDDSDDKKSITLFSTENIFERTAGLLRLPPLDKGQGLLINKCNSIHTFGMKYSLDVVYFNHHLDVVKIVENIKPKRMSFGFGAKHTLELLTGEINRLGIKKGMSLIFSL
jgi:uncharacterized membrane protein (UPF0127 family)